MVEVGKEGNGWLSESGFGVGEVWVDVDDVRIEGG